MLLLDHALARSPLVVIRRQTHRRHPTPPHPHRQPTQEPSTQPPNLDADLLLWRGMDEIATPDLPVRPPPVQPEIMRRLARWVGHCAQWEWDQASDLASVGGECREGEGGEGGVFERGVGGGGDGGVGGGVEGVGGVDEALGLATRAVASGAGEGHTRGE